MSQGRQRSDRSKIVAQAMLVWNDGTLDVETFIEKGNFGEGSGDTFKFDANIRAAVVAGFEGKG